MGALRRLGGVSACIPAANPKARKAIEKVAAEYTDVKIEVIDGGARRLLLAADCAVVASGTATLEAALAGCPTVLVYRVGRLLGWFARMVIKGISHVGLANIIAEKSGVECPMPELLQEDFTENAVVDHLKLWLDDPSELEKASKKLTDTVRLLESDGDAMGNIVRLIKNSRPSGSAAKSSIDRSCSETV
jgi:lipid-A-disaccharide synthase